VASEYAASSSGCALAPWPRRSGATTWKPRAAHASIQSAKSSFAPVNPWTSSSGAPPFPASAARSVIEPMSTSINFTARF
jgi:hypothetical protein